MDLENRVQRLESQLADLRDRADAAEIVAHLFYARLLNVCEEIGDPLDLDASLSRLREDLEEAAAKAPSPVQAAAWRRVAMRSRFLIEHIRDMRLAYRPANQNG